MIFWLEYLKNLKRTSILLEATINATHFNDLSINPAKLLCKPAKQNADFNKNYMILLFLNQNDNGKSPCLIGDTSSNCFKWLFSTVINGVSTGTSILSDHGPTLAKAHLGACRGQIESPAI